MTKRKTKPAIPGVQRHPLVAGLAHMHNAEQFHQSVLTEQARQFQVLANSPLVWLDCADCLLRSARAILDQAANEPGCLVLPALMLRGFALENLLRGVQTKRKPLVSNGKIALGPKAHRLLELAEEVLGPLRERAQILDLGMLQALTVIVRYSGRYPVPTKLEETVVVRGTFTEPGAQWDREKETCFRWMVLRLVTILKDEAHATASAQHWWHDSMMGDPPWEIPLPSQQRHVRKAMRLPSLRPS